MKLQVPTRKFCKAIIFKTDYKSYKLEFLYIANFTSNFHKFLMALYATVKFRSIFYIWCAVIPHNVKVTRINLSFSISGTSPGTSCRFITEKLKERWKFWSLFLKLCVFLKYFTTIENVRNGNYEEKHWFL